MSKSIVITLQPQTVFYLDTLCEHYGVSKSAMISTCIAAYSVQQNQMNPGVLFPEHLFRPDSQLSGS